MWAASFVDSNRDLLAMTAQSVYYSLVSCYVLCCQGLVWGPLLSVVLWTLASDLFVGYSLAAVTYGLAVSGLLAADPNASSYSS
jgi:hypothetical protein